MRDRKPGAGKTIPQITHIYRFDEGNEPCLNLQSLQSVPQSFKSTPFQDEPYRRFLRITGTLHRIRDTDTVQTETSLHSSDSTAINHTLFMAVIKRQGIERQGVIRGNIVRSRHTHKKPLNRRDWRPNLSERVVHRSNIADVIRRYVWGNKCHRAHCARSRCWVYRRRCA